MYFFSEYNYRGNHAGTKARNDVEKILKGYGAKALNTTQFVLRTDGNENQIQSNITNRLDLMRLFWNVYRIHNKSVLVQYPMLGFDYQKEFFRSISKHNKLVLLVHDIHSLRIPDKSKLQEEIALLNMASVLIVHNHFMEEKLRMLGVTLPKMFSLELFDYLYTGDICSNEKKVDSVAFAGNLQKSVFLKKMVCQNPDITFQLYGNGWDENYMNANYWGSFSPDEIPGKIDAAFGLVWDGESTESGEGALGEYTKINNPHKMSLYLASGIPVIVWKEAAVAEVVQKYQLGIRVDRIDNLTDVISNLSEECYTKLKESVKNYRKSVLHGMHLSKVLDTIEKE